MLNYESYTMAYYIRNEPFLRRYALQVNTYREFANAVWRHEAIQAVPDGTLFFDPKLDHAYLDEVVRMLKLENMEKHNAIH